MGRIFTLDTEKRKEAKVRKIDANPRMQLVKEIIKILILILIKMLSKKSSQNVAVCMEIARVGWLDLRELQSSAELSPSAPPVCDLEVRQFWVLR